MSNMQSPTNPGQTSLIPVNNCVLVKLEKPFENVTVKDAKYATRTQGIVVAVPELEYVPVEAINIHQLLGKRVYFEEYKDGTRIKREGQEYSFIQISDIRGYEEV
jgi:co-chaperonin GroES (HSP10)